MLNVVKHLLYALHLLQQILHCVQDDKGKRAALSRRLCPHRRFAFMFDSNKLSARTQATEKISFILK